MPILKPYRSTVPTHHRPVTSWWRSCSEQAVTTGQKLAILLTTGFAPLTDIISARKPQLTAGIDRVVWMGGAINVAGNLDPSTISQAVANKHAEWNVFCDPIAAQDGLDMIKEIHDFPFDITNGADSKPFMARLAGAG